MKLIGLCGSSGSGKSLAAGYFSSRGIPVIDADAVYHDLTSRPSPCVRQIAKSFGDGVLRPDGSLDRRALARIVFSSPDAEGKTAALNALTHKYVIGEVEAMLRREPFCSAPVVIFDAPLLFESGFDRKCEKTVFVSAPVPAKISRIVCRDGIGEREARTRLERQKSDEELRALCDDEIANDTTPAALFAACEAYLEKIL